MKCLTGSEGTDTKVVPRVEGSVMKQSRRIVVAGVVALSGCSLLTLGGCNSGHLAQFRSHPTPELGSLAMRPAELDNRTTITFDTNRRAMTEDLRRIFLLDRPTRLTFSPSGY